MSDLIFSTITVLVDETKTVEEAVEICNFGCRDADINNKNFLRIKNGQKSEKEIAIFDFGKPMSSEDVVVEMDKIGYKPATIFDILSLVVEARMSKLQWIFRIRIVALGSVCNNFGGSRVAYLDEFSNCGQICLERLDDGFGSRSCFAAVCK
jgi:aminoglycoside N3'-acetyltransferase